MFMAVEMSSMEGFPMADKPLKWVRTFLPLAQVPPMVRSPHDPVIAAERKDIIA